MFKTVIIEDDRQQVRSLKKLISEYCPRLEVVGEAYDMPSAHKLIKRLSPDLLLLDIVLHKSTAFDLLEKLQPFDFEVIFMTAYEKHILKAIKFSPVDYLIKPIDAQELQVASRKAIQKITSRYINNQLNTLLMNVKTVQSNLNQKIAVPTVEGFVFVQINEIIRCEAKGAYTCIYTSKKEKITASRNIKEYENILPESNFFRVHNSHLININRIARYNKGRGGTITMEDGTQIEVASRRRAEFLSRFQ